MPQLLAAIFLICFLTPLLIGILWAYTSITFPACPRHFRLNPFSPDVPPAFTNFLAQTERTLYPLGFNLLCCLQCSPLGSRLRLLAIFENPRTNDRAIASLTFVHWFKHIEPLTHSLEFLTEFTDASIVATDNSATIHGCPAPANAPTQTLHTGGPPVVSFLQLPSVRNPTRLYQIHQALLQQHRLKTNAAPCQPAPDDPPTSPLRFADMLATARFYHQFAAGRLYLNEETDTLHPTWRGALAIATAELFPLNLLRKLASQRYAAHILQSAALPLPRPLPAQVI